MKFKKLTAITLSFVLALAMTIQVSAAPDAAAAAEEIVILHTNDVHCGIDDSIGYAGLAAYKNEMERQYGPGNVTLDRKSVV